MGSSDSKPIKEKASVTESAKAEVVKEDVSIAEPEEKNTSVAEIVEKDIIVKCSLEEIAQSFFRDSMIVWHDPNSNSKENQDHKAQLEELCQVLAFTEWEPAKDYIQSTQAACHVITSGANGELFVKAIFENKNVCNIYVFCGDKKYHSTWAENYWKVVCVETRIETVLNQIKKTMGEWLKEEDALKLDLPAFAPIFNDWDKSAMNHLHLYLKMIPNFKNRVQAKEDFVSLSKRIYSKRGDMKDLEEFEQCYNEYNKEQTLRWYTRPSFLFKIINKCLRIATSDSIQYCRLLLKDIERAIKEQYQTKSKNFHGLLYRGAYMSEQEWWSLKGNRDKEIEMHGFLSVSKEKDVALNFMRSDQSQKVFITIIVPKGPNEEEQGFAEIEEFSRFPKEKEILFNVRSRFTVLETEDEWYSEELPFRHLVLLYGAQGFRKFITEKKPTQKISIASFENLSCCNCKEQLFGMSEKVCFIPIADIQKQIYYCKKCLDYDAAPFLYIPLMDKALVYETYLRGFLLINANQRQTPCYGYKCYNCQVRKEEVYFICIDCCEKNGNENWCEDCFERISKCRTSEHQIIIETSPFSFWFKSMSQNELNHLKFHNEVMKENNQLFEQGGMYFETHEYKKAIEYYSLYIQGNEGIGKTANLATAYNNLGKIFEDQKEYKEALEYYFESLDIRKLIYGDNHSDVAASYNNIGRVYFDQREYEKALEYHFKSLNIRKLIYGENHSSVAASYLNIGNVYNVRRDYVKTLEYYFKSLENRRLIYGENHPLVATCYNNIGCVYKDQREYDKALDYFLKCLDIYKSIHGDNHPDVALYYSNLAGTYCDQRDYEKALEYQAKSLDIYQSIHGENHSDVGISYDKLGSVYENQGEYKKALEYYFKSLDITKLIYGNNHPTVAAAYNKIAWVYADHGEDKKASEYFSKALGILGK